MPGDSTPARQPCRMRAAMLLEPGKIEMRDVPVPIPGPGELVLKMEAVLTCGTDLKAWRRGHPRFPFPIKLGHEFSGTVAAAGPGTSFAAGEPVLAAPSAPCLECRNCRRGLFNLCDTIIETMSWGAFADYLLLPRRIVEQNVFPKPAHVSFLRGAFLEPLACVVYGQANTPIVEGDTVVICGCGTIGLMHAMLARRRGAERILITGRHAARLERARQMNVGEVIDIDAEEPIKAVHRRTQGRGAEVVIECVGRAQAWTDASLMVAPGGFVLLFGGCPGGSTATFDTARLHYDQVTLKGVFHFRPEDVRGARDLLCDTDLPVERLLSGSYPLDEIARVMERLDRGEGIKYALLP